MYGPMFLLWTSFLSHILFFWRNITTAHGLFLILRATGECMGVLWACPGTRPWPIWQRGGRGERSSCVLCVRETWNLLTLIGGCTVLGRLWANSKGRCLYDEGLKGDQEEGKVGCCHCFLLSENSSCHWARKMALVQFVSHLLPSKTISCSELTCN